MMYNILEDNNIAFHGINYDYFKMLSILKEGILSQNAAKNSNININRNYKGYNSDNLVSLSESPSIHNTYNYGAFNVFVKKGISFVVDVNDLYCILDTKSGIPGEVYINYSVPRENIIGIMLPEQMLHTSISQLNILADIGTAFIDNYAINFIEQINSTFRTTVSKKEVITLIELKKGVNGDFFDKYQEIKRINMKINEIITNLFDLAFRFEYNLIESPTLIDAITILTEGDIPIYSTNGILLSYKKHKAYRLSYFEKR